MVDSQRQQTEERALKMKSVLVKTKKELAEAKKQVLRLSPTPPPPPPIKCSILTPLCNTVFLDYAFATNIRHFRQNKRS